MPLYDYQCPEHGQFDVLLKISELRPTFKCPKCGRKSKRIVVSGHGGVHCDSINDVSWLPSAVQNLPDDAAVKIQSRKNSGILNRKIYIISIASPYE